MIEYSVRCKDCQEKFCIDLPTIVGNYSKVYDHGVLKYRYYVDGVKVSKVEYDKAQPENRIKESGTKCPKCSSSNIEKLISSNADFVFSDEIRPNSGFSKVDRRHQDGMYWDSPTAAIEGKEVNREMARDGYNKALRMAERDEQTLAKQYRKVSEREAKEYLSNPNRKGDVHIVKYPNKPAD